VPVIDACAKASAGTKTNHESTVVNFTNPRIAHLRSGRLIDLGLNYGCGAETVKVLSGDFALLDQRLTFVTATQGVVGFQVRAADLNRRTAASWLHRVTRV
jgi:hypothetical protein